MRLVLAIASAVLFWLAFDMSAARTAVFLLALWFLESAKEVES